MSLSPVEELEREFLPQLEAAREVFVRQFPAYVFAVGSHSIGGLTTYQGHMVWLECTFPNALPNDADTVAIIVGVKHLTTNPQLCEASVEWGHGWHPDIAMDLVQDPVPFSTAQLSAISSRFKELVATLQSAVLAVPGRVSA